MDTQEITVGRWLEIRKDAGLKIHPETAEVCWEWARTLDPYGVHSLIPEEDQVGREYFARSPGSDIWVSFHDLPEATRCAIRERNPVCVNSGFPDDLVAEIEIVQLGLNPFL